MRSSRIITVILLALVGHCNGISEEPVDFTINVFNDFDSLANGCGLVPADIIFILDTSGSVGRKNFKKMLQFVEELVNDFEIGPNKTQVGVITYSKRPHLVFHLKEYDTKAKVIQAINNTRYFNGGTQTHRALEFVRTQCFLPANGARTSVAKIAIVITDGESQYKMRTKQEATKIREMGSKVFAIGVGKAFNMEELNDMASDPDDQHVFTVTNFDALAHIKNILAKKTCEVQSEEAPTTAVAQSADTPTKVPSLSVPSALLPIKEDACISTKTGAFHVELSADVQLGKKHGVIFDKVVMNTGNVYNPANGHFTAPTDGIYFFAFSMPVTGLTGVYFEMLQNQNELIRTSTIVRALQESPEKSLMNTVGFLRKGDVVKIIGIYYKLTLGGHGSSFTGYLMNEINFDC